MTTSEAEKFKSVERYADKLRARKRPSASSACSTALPHYIQEENHKDSQPNHRNREERGCQQKAADEEPAHQYRRDDPAKRPHSDVDTLIR
jgi:hypothetical protein